MPVDKALSASKEEVGSLEEQASDSVDGLQRAVFEKTEGLLGALALLGATAAPAPPAAPAAPAAAAATAATAAPATVTEPPPPAQGVAGACEDVGIGLGGFPVAIWRLSGGCVVDVGRRWVATRVCWVLVDWV